MAEHRDEWGETAEERHDRILARDLAYLAFEEGRKRDGLTTTGPVLLAFNAGYAAGRADYLQTSRGASHIPSRHPASSAVEEESTAGAALDAPATSTERVWEPGDSPVLPDVEEPPGASKGDESP